MQDACVDSTTMEGQQRIRAFALGWLERLDYASKLERAWDAEELGVLLWQRFEEEYRPVWEGPLVTNPALAEVIATTMVEDYFRAYSERRSSRYTVSGPLSDGPFRRCVIDFVHDLEEFEPEILPAHPDEAAAMFWRDVRQSPKRWGYDPRRGPFVDDEARAHEVARDALREYYTLKERVAEIRGTL